MLKYPKCGVNENDVLKIPFSQESIGSSPISGMSENNYEKNTNMRYWKCAC